jgi:hypothetical protein
MTMHDEDRDEKKVTKKPYQPPEITRVPLRPDEAVLGSCKAAASSGPFQSDCTSPSTCSDSGS